ncbi:phage tail protein [Mesorhizobium sp. ESP6-5]|uniref:phage tail protein n=1 Tax=Mesorhizobium sp. ESP6-5 TaxID=2876623 RepID=UPI001CCC5E74|nr:phage tail protein [Mesorhizobium sp. ESP6-5]MBZ9757849.1 phage tail protein [Mesorhizobium sp. ESP6-5]
MSIPTFDPPVGPSPGTAHKPTVNLWEADFGDGYNQPTPKGLNHIRRATSLKWSALTYGQMRDIVEFFERQGGSLPFYFRPYGEEVSRKWTCKDWSATADNGVWSVTAELSESFTLAV